MKNTFHKTLKAVFFSLVCSTVIAQPQLNTITGPTESLGGWGTMPPSYNSSINTKVVGDFNGDGLDDILWYLYSINTNGTVSYTFKILKGNGNGAFSLLYDNKGQLEIATSNSSPVDIQYNTKYFFKGNFSSLPGDELLIHTRIAGSGTDSYHILNFSTAVPSLVSTDATGFIGYAPIVNRGAIHNNTKFFTANLSGTSYDELFSIEKNSQNVVTARVQGVLPSTYLWSNGGSGWIGAWAIDWDRDEFYFGDFYADNNAGGVKPELLCISKSGWVMIQQFTGTGWALKYHNAGNFNVYKNPDPNTASTYTITANTKFMVGNFDGDANAELIVYEKNNPASLTSMEFIPANQNPFFNFFTKPSINLTGIYGTSQSTTATVISFERWTTPRKCTSSFLGICFSYSGGESYAAARPFYTTTSQNGELEYITGNFYTNARADQKEVLAFSNSSSSYPNMPNNAYFLTSCPGTNMYSGTCGQYINIYNTLGQYINLYDSYNGSFSSNIGWVNNTKYAMFSSLSSSLRTSGEELTNIPLKEEHYNLPFSLNIYPNPTENNITLNFAIEEEQEDITIKVYSSIGNQVDELKAIFDKGQNDLVYDSEKLDAGNYILHAVSAKTNLTKRFIKM